VLAKTSALAIFSVFMATAGQLLLKNGMQQVGYVGTKQLARPSKLLVEIGKTPLIWLGLALFVVSAAVWLIVLSRAPLSFAYPFAGLTYVLITLFSRFVLREHVAFPRWAGILLIVAGIVLVARTAPPALDEAPDPGDQREVSVRR
jgi:multidrug transporter EmrE-like cation transporter